MALIITMANPDKNYSRPNILQEILARGPKYHEKIDQCPQKNLINVRKKDWFRAEITAYWPKIDQSAFEISKTGWKETKMDQRKQNIDQNRSKVSKQRSA